MFKRDIYDQIRSPFQTQSTVKYALKTNRLFDGEQWLEQHCVVIENGLVSQLLPNNQLSTAIETTTVNVGTVAPGFIDLQVNGGGGVMLSDKPCRESVDIMTAAHRLGGTTSMMPTALSETIDNQNACVTAVRMAREQGNHGVLGIHLEGPFFDSEKRGAHAANMIRTLTEDDIAWLGSLTDLRLIVTLAPEHTQPGQIQSLTAAGIHVFAGHTNANYEQLSAAAQQGLRGITHLFNAMSPLTGREPGAVGAALDNDQLWVGVIADNHHVHPVNIRLAQKIKPRGKLFLVTDAMATVGCADKTFEMYGEKIQEKEGKLINRDGVLAGSAITMMDAVRIANTVAGIPLEETLRMAAAYPAGLLRCDKQLGFIRPGYRADMVHFDEDFKVYNTWVAGARQRHR
jgi:N-acetylglucosamine-6-phosphate deacetylase